MNSVVQTLLVVLLLSATAFAQRSTDAEADAESRARARRQEGVFFGLGGLDAHSMPFDLDAFFEHAAPTRTTRSGLPTGPSTPRPQRKTSFPAPSAVARPATSRSSAGSDGGHFDSFPERREPPVTSSRFLLPTDVPQRNARPTFQNVQRAPVAFASSDQDQGFSGRTHNADSLQQRFSPQPPPTRQQFVERPAQKEFDQQASQPIRRPLPSSFRDVRPQDDTVQEVLSRNPTLQANRLPSRQSQFRPSQASETVQRFPASADSVRPTSFADDSLFDNRQRFPVRRPAASTETPRFHGQSPASSATQDQRQEQRAPEDSFQDFDDSRPFSDGEEHQQSFLPEEDQFDSTPFDSSEGPTQPFFSSQEDAPLSSSDASQAAPNSHLDFGPEAATDSQQHPEDDLLEDPHSQDPPLQDVEDEDYSQEPEFFVPDTKENIDRRPFQSQEEVASNGRRPAPQFASQERPASAPKRLPTLQQSDQAEFSRPQSSDGNSFNPPQQPSFQTTPVHRSKPALQPSLSHRGISGVVQTPQLVKPEPPRHFPRVPAINDDANRHPNEARFSSPPRSSPPRTPEAESNFDFRAPVRVADPTTQKPRFAETQPPIRSDQHHFRQIPSGFRSQSPSRTHAPTAASIDTFQDENFDDNQEQVFTRIPSHHTKPGVLGVARAPTQVTSQFFQSNDESTGQLSPSFVRATEPTNFEAETERPERPRFSLSSSHFSGPSTQFEAPRDRSQSRAPQVLQRTTTVRRRPLPRPETTSASIQTDFAFNSPQSTVDASTHFQLPLSKFSTSDEFSFNRRPSGLQDDSDSKLKSRKRLPVTQSGGRLVTANRGSKRGPVLPGRTSAAQFVTENSINDISVQESLPTRTRGGSHSSGGPSAPVVPGQPARVCNPAVCHLPNCFCGGNQISPGNLRPEEIPQIIVLTFDDAVNDLNWALYTRLFFKDRKNPNGCPILSTFYVSHEWTDYSKVQNLYAAGHEIASHSISHGDGRDYSKKKWYNEIYGQREILSVYANVKLDDIKGMRTPFLAMGGDKQFSMLYETNFTYESSMTVTDVHPPYWPYTLDYAVPHRCAIPPCPKLSYPGFWEIPMVALTDLNGGKCSMADSCSFATTEDGIYEMLMKNFERHYTSNKSPFGLYYHASWFLVPHRQEGFVKFLEEILQKDDVYVVTALQMLEWVKNPTPLSQIQHFEPWRCDRNDRVPPCNRPKSCELRFKGDTRYMSTCNSCPNVYPWVGDTGVTKHVHTISS